MDNGSTSTRRKKEGSPHSEQPNSVTPRRLLLQERANRMTDPVDPVPVEVPLEYQQAPTLEERLQAFVRQELSSMAGRGELPPGTFDEEDDFDEDFEDADLLTDYQVLVMAEEAGELPPAEPDSDRALEAAIGGDTAEPSASPADPASPQLPSPSGNEDINQSSAPQAPNPTQ